MDKKFSAFLEIARTLNEHNIVPILYGSLGFYHLINRQSDEISDTDIVVPNLYVTDKFEELKTIMISIGYKQDKDYPHEFSKGESPIGFEPESDLLDLKINTANLKITELENAKFKELSLQDYLKVYKRNLQTHEPKVMRIKKKIEVIEKMLK